MHRLIVFVGLDEAGGMVPGWCMDGGWDEGMSVLGLVMVLLNNGSGL